MTLEQRFEALEKEIADLKERLALLDNATSHSMIQLQKTISVAEKKAVKT